MDLPTYLQRTGATGGLDDTTLQQVTAALAGETTFAQIARRKDLGVPLPALVGVAEGCLAFRRRERLARTLPRTISPRIADQALDPHQVQALQRLVAGFPEVLWEPGFTLWRHAFALALKAGEIKVDGQTGTDFDEYLLQREAVENISPHRWLRIRRGERSGALKLDVRLPIAGIRDQAERMRLPDTLRDAIVEHLPWDLRRYLDHRAETEAIRAARTTYQGLLCSPPVSAFPVMAVAIGRTIGVALLDAKAKVRHHEVARREEAVVAIAQRRQPKTIVLPTRSPQQGRLATLKSRLGQTWSVTQVLPAGLSAAVRGLDLPRIVASAVVLGRRAIDPLGAWSRMDPVRLGLVEFQADLNEARLRESLSLTRDIVLARGAEQNIAPVSGPTLGLSQRRLDDLRPGQMVEGVVTNITPFGAFVNIGIEPEGLIHVSEIADRFVKDPADVVRIGQVVLAKVLEVDPARGRISLSLRREKRPPRRAERERKRSQAIDDLNKLFKA